MQKASEKRKDLESRLAEIQKEYEDAIDHEKKLQIEHKSTIDSLKQFSDSESTNVSSVRDKVSQNVQRLTTVTNGLSHAVQNGNTDAALRILQDIVVDLQRDVAAYDASTNESSLPVSASAANAQTAMSVDSTAMPEQQDAAAAEENTLPEVDLDGLNLSSEQEQEVSRRYSETQRLFASSLRSHRSRSRNRGD